MLSLEKTNIPDRSIETALQYVINVLQYDIIENLIKEKNILSNIDLDEENKNLLQKKNCLNYIAARDALSILLLINHTGEIEYPELLVEKGINTAIQQIKAKVLCFGRDINVTLKSFEKNVFIKAPEIIIETVVCKMFDLVFELLSEQDIEFSYSYDSGFLTISMKYCSDEDVLQNSGPKHQCFDFQFNNAFSVLKIFENIRLGVLSFAKNQKHNYINFTFYMEARVDDFDFSIYELSKENIKTYDWSDKTVLIVDDIDVNYIFLQTILDETKVKTIYAENGQKAIDICKKEKVDAVLMDLKMPVMDGYKATEEIKKMNPDLPIIIQTAYSFDEEYEKCTKAGCNDILTKPLKSEEVLRILEKYLN